MSTLKKLFKKIKENKGITGADIAAAITVIVLTVGIVTAIYVNTINKSKDNVRYANATRIATSIMENIQKKPYDYLVAICNTSASASNGEKLFETKIPNGFTATVTAKKASSDLPDLARDVTVKVTYKANNSYKSINLTSVKVKELLEMTNRPDISFIAGYNPSDKGTYYYPVKKSGSKNVITTTSDIEWYNYEKDGSNKATYALVCVTNDGELNVGADVPSSSKIFAWIPRYGASGSGTSSTVQFLYNASSYKITYNAYQDADNKILNAYGLAYESGKNATNSNPASIADSWYVSFAKEDGLSGVWYEVGGSYSTDDTIYKIAKDFNSRVICQNATLP